jgi:hypothetical protein
MSLTTDQGEAEGRTEVNRTLTLVRSKQTWGYF